MTDEIKTCDCKEKCLKTLGKFALNAGAVFVGATLAILLSASILRPKCPPPMMMAHPGIHRQLPPPAMYGRYGDCPCKHFRKHHGKDFHKKFHRQAPPQVEKPAK